MHKHIYLNATVATKTRTKTATTTVATFAAKSTARWKFDLPAVCDNTKTTKLNLKIKEKFQQSTEIQSNEQQMNNVPSTSCKGHWTSRVVNETIKQRQACKQTDRQTDRQHVWHEF